MRAHQQLLAVLPVRVLAAGAVAMLWLTLVVSSASAETRCGTVVRDGESGPYLAAVHAEGIDCAQARALARPGSAWWKAGWECHSGGHEGVCERGDARLRWQPPPTRRCRKVVFTPRTEDGISRVRAYRTPCTLARRVARRARPLSMVSGPYRYRHRGFVCRGVFDETTLPMVYWTCIRGAGRSVEFVRH